MAIKKIVTEPNEVLHKKCSKITDFGNDTASLAQDLLDTVRAAKNPEGAGLAAPQIGVLKRMCVVRKFNESEDENSPITIFDFVLINPVILKNSKETELGWEACLSLPDVYANVERHQKIKVRAQDVHGKMFQINASGFFARVMQHEIDHLDGVLITDKNVGEILNEQQFDEISKRRY